MKTLFKSSFPLVWKRLRLFNSNPGKSNMKQISYQDKDPEPQMAPADKPKNNGGKCAAFMQSEYTK